MLFLIALILAWCFAFLCGKSLKKYPSAFYVIAVGITAITVILAGSKPGTIPDFVNTYIVGLFTRGAFATALWCVVMWTGAMPNGSAPIKKLMPIRGELSIFAALLTLGHNIGFGQTYFVMLFTDAGKMTSNQLVASILTIIMLVIMIPLTVLSFPQVRRKINAKRWKNIQRTAYAFYALIYIHVMILCYPMAKAGREGYLFNIFIYSLVFIGYAVCRIRKWYVMRKKVQKTTIVNIVCIAVIAVLTAIAVFLSKAENISDRPSSSAETTQKAEESSELSQESEASGIYKDGTYTASAYGYDGDVEVTVTIENGVITSISGTTQESDSWYYESAEESVISQILSSQSTDVDAVSGATYSSKAIMSAVQKALDSAKN